MGQMIADEAIQLLHRNNFIVMASEPDHQNKALSQLVSELDPCAIIVRTGTLDARAISAAKSLKVIAKHGVGVDMIDVQAASKRSIPVMITPGANARSVAEHALALTLAVLRDIPGLDSRLKKGEWEKSTHRGRELSGKHVGLIGYGKIAQAFVSLLEPFDVNITIYTRTPPAVPSTSNITFTSQLVELLKQSELISLHCPLTERTRHILDHEQFAQLKSGAIIINTARGELINETALLEALGKGVVAGAGLDCFAVEPPEAGNELVCHPQIIATPHIGWATQEASGKMGLITAENIISAFGKKELEESHTVNLAELIADDISNDAC